MKKWLLGAGTILCLGVGCLAVYHKISDDRQPPVISIDGEIAYTEGMHDELLEGVTAMDDVDGDVSDSLVIETVTLNAKEGTAVVIYAARDKSNNISKVNRIVEYEQAETDEESESETEEITEKTTEKTRTISTVAGMNRVDSDEEESDEESETDSETDSVSETDSEEESETGSEIETEPESESEELTPGAPVLKLTELSATIAVGDTFNPLFYVASIEDDYDNIYELWQNIQLRGDYDVNKPGRYNLTFHVVDSAGNMSNQAKFLLIVKEEM